VYADPQSAQLIAELNRSFHLNVKAADNDIDVGIQRLTQLFREGRLKVFSNCQNLIDELETYHYPTPDDEGAVKDKPVAKNNHACDALRYGFSESKGRTTNSNIDPLDMGRGQKHRRFIPTITRSQWEGSRNAWTGY
jgi:phage terminase large subunit